VTWAYHPGYVLDASVVTKWFVRRAEAGRDTAIGLRAGHVAGRFRIVVPELCLIEVANALRYSPKAREEEIAEALDALSVLALEVVAADANLLKKANAIAWGYGVTMYDALYVAIAELRSHPLVTADDALMRKMRGHSIVLDLRDLEFPMPGK
jgi:predicted nucleic acid-binding protein